MKVSRRLWTTTKEARMRIKWKKGSPNSERFREGLMAKVRASSEIPKTVISTSM